MAFQAALLSSGRIVPSVTIVESNYIYPSIAGGIKPYHGQFSASTHPRAALVGTIVQKRKLLVICRIKPGTWMLQLLLDDRCRPSCFRTLMYRGGGHKVVVSTAAFHARFRGSVSGLGGLKETKMFLAHARVKLSIVESLSDREVACSASHRQGTNFESCV